jgi:hypothetical protein
VAAAQAVDPEPAFEPSEPFDPSPRPAGRAVPAAVDRLLRAVGGELRACPRERTLVCGERLLGRLERRFGRDDGLVRRSQIGLRGASRHDDARGTGVAERAVHQRL